MPETEVKPNDEGKDAHKKERLFDQEEVNYTTVSLLPGKACAGCRWFETYGSEYSRQDECHLVQNWPLAIEPTGYCDRYEAYPLPQPITQTPMPVVIVDPTELDTGAAEVRDKALFDRIWDGIQKRLGWKSNEPLTTGFKVEGNHWLAVWSNNFKDRDGELFTAKAMDDYVARADMGAVPLPELWVWHAGKQVAIGSADWVSTHDHFLMAAGQFYGAAAAKTAKAYYAKHAPETGISHGYTYPESKFDGKAYHQFNTFEISLLPRGAEANWYTSLEGVKAMPLSEDKQKYLKEVFGEEHATRILADWEKRGKALETIGVEFKDFAAPNGETQAASTSAKAVDAAEKSLKDLFPELVEGSAEAVTVALEAARRVKTVEADNAVLRAELKDIRAELNLKPKSVAQGGGAVLDPEKGKAVYAEVEQQFAKKDDFWGTTVTETP